MSIDELETLTKTERRIYTVISKSPSTIKELSIIFDCQESTIRYHLYNLKQKGLISNTVILNDTPRKVYFIEV